MPKTKLGSETKNYGVKKAKRGAPRCDLRSSLASEESVKFYQETSSAGAEGGEGVERSGVRVHTSPFTCTVLEGVVEQEEFLEELQQELEGLEFQEKNNDLYRFRQSGELAASPLPLIAALREMLVHQVRPWVARATGLELDERVSLFCAKYGEGDTLLCHDDELEGRRVAFIYYLVHRDWGAGDGGTLDLFTTDQQGNPGQVALRLTPSHNSLAFFEVSPVSFHQVSEVTSSRTRLSLGGWFHGPPGLPRPHRVPPTRAPCLRAEDIPEEDFYSWIHPAYLAPDTQAEVQTKFEETSEISLPGFFQKHKFAEVCAALRGVADWEEEGAPDRRREFLTLGAAQPALAACRAIVTSEPFFLLLSNLTGLRLHELAPEDSDGEEEEGKEFDPRCRAAFAHRRPGSYTLVRDDDLEQAEFALDLRIFFNCAGWRDSMGGQSSYIARGEDEELITVEPEGNSLSLVYRDKDSLRFVKYVNRQVEEMGGFHDLSATYYE